MADENKSGSSRDNIFIKALNFLMEWGGMIFLVLMTLIVNFTVVTRYFLSYTPSWGESGALLCMVWFGFLSMALGVRDNQHISITILDHMLPPKVLRFLDYFKVIAVFCFGIFMIREGKNLYDIGLLNDMPGLAISSAWQYLAVPVSGFAFCVYSFTQFIGLIKYKGGTANGN